MKYKTRFCGIDCVVPMQSDIWKILAFEGINLDLYYFYVVDQSIHSSICNFKIPERFDLDYLRKIDPQSSYVDRLVLHLYPKTTVPEMIDTYDDFCHSLCEMIVLICDVCYIEIYCKNHSWLEKIKHIAEGIYGSDVEDKFEGNDPRTVMYV